MRWSLCISDLSIILYDKMTIWYTKYTREQGANQGAVSEREVNSRSMASREAVSCSGWACRVDRKERADTPSMPCS
jgi:hypothetical protein